MSELKNLTALFFLLVLYGNAISQTPTDSSIQKLFGKHWMIASYEVDGIVLPVSAPERGGVMTFFPDHLVSTTNYKVLVRNIWLYDNETKLMTLCSDKDTLTTRMKIVYIKDDAFTWETKSKEGKPMKVLMIPHPDKK